MKKFIFSLLIAILISFATYYPSLQEGNDIATKITEFNTSLHSCPFVLKIEKTLNSKNLLPEAYHDIAFNGVLTLLLLWITLSIIFGIKGFFSDLKCFFPIKK